MAGEEKYLIYSSLLKKLNKVRPLTQEKKKKKKKKKKKENANVHSFPFGFEACAMLPYA